MLIDLLDRKQKLQTILERNDLPIHQSISILGIRILIRCSWFLIKLVISVELFVIHIPNASNASATAAIPWLRLLRRGRRRQRCRLRFLRKLLCLRILRSRIGLLLRRRRTQHRSSESPPPVNEESGSRIWRSSPIYSEDLLQSWARIFHGGAI